MSDNIVRTGVIYALSSSLAKKLGRRVLVHRVVDKFTLPGGRGGAKTTIRYSLGIEGSHPPVFFNMTVGEVKSRMAFLLDLLASGVVHASPPISDGPGRTDQASPSAGGSALVPENAQGSDGDRAAGVGQSPGSDDSY